MELTYPVDRGKYDRLIDVLCQAGIDEWRAEAALCSYVSYALGRHVGERYDEVVLMSTRPRRQLGNDVEVVVFDEWLRLGDESTLISSDIKDREEQAWRKTSSRWWTAERVIQGR